ncbi:MAG: RDD family protein [Epsilonproteobacteria bacterium]|nr:RDD family protein [Campylobacterota bacterium]
MNIAPIRKRILSFVIDDIVLSLFVLVIFYDKLTDITDMETMSAFMADNFLAIMLVKVSYHWILVWQNGMTMGNYIMKIKVIDESSGERLNVFMALNRSMLRILSESIFYIGFLFAFFSSKVQTFHDKFTNAVVIDV